MTCAKVNMACARENMSGAIWDMGWAMLAMEPVVLRNAAVNLWNGDLIMKMNREIVFLSELGFLFFFLDKKEQENQGCVNFG